LLLYTDFINLFVRRLQLLGELNKKFGCSETLTFDRAAIKANNFKLAE
jgi:hypothetical protein